MTSFDLAKQILHYESDTFSASGSKITEMEAGQIAGRLIERWSNELLDGISIDEILEDIRN